MLEEVRRDSERNRAVAVEGIRELLSTAQQEIDHLKAVSLNCSGWTSLKIFLKIGSC